MKIRFLFYKAAIDGKPLDDAISLWTFFLAIIRLDIESLKFNYSHVEVWIPSTYEDEFSCIESDGHTAYGGQCFSSTTRGECEGVRWAPANKVLKHPERWVYQEFEVDDERFEVFFDESMRLVGKKYDYLGLFGFFVPWNTQDKNKWYCSEICTWGVRLLNLLPKKKKWYDTELAVRIFGLPYARISPRRLAKVLGGEVHKLA